MRNLMIVLMSAALLASPVSAKQPLREISSIDDALLDLGVADLIRKNCPSISARKIKAFNYMMALKAQANGLGYSDTEIRAYIKNEDEKDRMRARGAAFFRSRGVDTSNPQSYCALGRAEIQKSSRIGSLLRAK